MRGRKGIISRRRVSWAELTDDPLIYKVYVWAFTQGLSVAPVKLEGEYAPSPEDADTFERILLFLESGLEYEWPPEPGDRELGVWQHLRWAVTNVFTGGALYRREMCAYWSAGDKHAWPFLRMEDYEAELRKKRPAP
ncbi:MAG: hypothetical protein JXR94_04950 [Candidatus Hydrogenedentes bacterium]|nr:hypothetical protein [Candidatus Hydrogenedentota bacterium]